MATLSSFIANKQLDKFTILLSMFITCCKLAVTSRILTVTCSYVSGCFTSSSTNYGTTLVFVDLTDSSDHVKRFLNAMTANPPILNGVVCGPGSVKIASTSLNYS